MSWRRMSYETIKSTDTVYFGDSRWRATQREQTNFVNWTAPASVYFLVLARGNLNLAGVFTISGTLNIEASVSNGQVFFQIAVNATLTLSVAGNQLHSRSMSMAPCNQQRWSGGLPPG